MPSLRCREQFEKEEQELLAPYAVKSSESQGRLWPEAEHRYRTAFQRDRDRVVHSTAFRRLEHKTQVFVSDEGDHYRNRLTHTLEGAQITRTISRTLRLNEDLAEAISLAHDLGHTPFGHAGERAMAARMRAHGGFDHNRQSLRVVDLLEQRYPAFGGLNLSHETREGIMKHGDRWEHPVSLPELGRQRSMESQVADAADEIAYMNHDLDDALRSGLLTLDDVAGLPLVSDAMAQLDVAAQSAPDHVKRSQIIIAIIDRLVTDLLEETERSIEGFGIAAPDAVRHAAQPMVHFSRDVDAAKRKLKNFLHKNFYLHPEVAVMTTRAEVVVGELLATLAADTDRVPEQIRARFDQEGEMRAIADYVAGMTDRFALSEHARLLGGSGVGPLGAV